MSDKEDFRNALSDAVQYALNEADAVEDKGGIDTMVSASVDGRTGFASDMKQFGNETGNGWALEDVKMSDDYGLVLGPLNTQHYKVKRAAYEAFAERMADHGWNCSLDIEQYAY